MRGYGVAVLAIGWIVWFRPFALAARRREPPHEVDPRWRFGLRLVLIAYSITCLGLLWPTPTPAWRIIAAACLLAMAGILSWTSTRALGRHWRIEAALSAEHDLVTWGPYRFVRHPIYTSMLCMLCGMGLLMTPWPLLLSAVVLFFVGTEIRVRAEERLLAARFGEQFRKYQRTVPAYVPFVW